MNKSNAPIIRYQISDELTDEALNALYLACWPEHRPGAYRKILDRSLLFVTAHYGEQLVGFVNLAWDGGEHTFLLDTTVHPEFRHRGIGTELCNRAVSEAACHDIKWVHVDFEPHLRGFYADCGFRPTEAGLIRLNNATGKMES